MQSTLNLNRRQWLKTTGTAVAGIALTSQLITSKARAQHEEDRSAKRAEPARLSGNENPFGPSQMAIMAMMQNLERSFRYAGKETKELMGAIAAKEGVTEEQIMLGAGSGAILDAVGTYLGQMKGEVIIAQPGYGQLARVMEKEGSKIVNVPLDASLVHDLDAMVAKVTADTKCFYICNPNNPTGTIIPPAKLKAVAIEIAKKCTVFIDEAYLECSDDFKANTMVSLVAEGHNVVIARTFSKVYGLAGQRVGYGVMSAEMVKKCREFGSGSLNLLGVVAAKASLEDPTYVEETRAKIKAGRDELLAVIKSLGKKYAEPQGNFVFFQTGMPIKDFQAKMAAEMVQVGRPFPPMLDWCRISIGNAEEMTMCHAALKKVLA